MFLGLAPFPSPVKIRLSINGECLSRLSIAVYEAKNRFSEPIAAVEQGEEITDGFCA
jgi:hypothetical protein